MSITTDTPITRDNAYEALGALLEAERDLMERARAAAPAERCALYRQAAANQQQQAHAWEARPGRRRDTQPAATSCRHQAQLCHLAADLEELRAAAQERGHPGLPDPAVVLTACSADPPTDALTELYTAAAGGPPD